MFEFEFEFVRAHAVVWRLQLHINVNFQKDVNQIKDSLDVFNLTNLV